MKRYKVTAPRPVNDTEPGGEFEHDFTAEEEADLLASGRVELVPRSYQVVGPNRVCGHEPGETFMHAFRIPEETALIEGGHIEAVSPAPKKAASVAAHKKEK